MTAYATQSGDAALEQEDPGVRNSWFTAALLRHIKSTSARKASRNRRRQAVVMRHSLEAAGAGVGAGAGAGAGAGGSRGAFPVLTP